MFMTMAEDVYWYELKSWWAFRLNTFLEFIYMYLSIFVYFF